MMAIYVICMIIAILGSVPALAMLVEGIKGIATKECSSKELACYFGSFFVWVAAIVFVLSPANPVKDDGKAATKNTVTVTTSTVPTAKPISTPRPTVRPQPTATPNPYIYESLDVSSSSSLAAAVYFPNLEKLAIIFRNHTEDTYLYDSVPYSVWLGLAGAESRGSYYNDYIKGQYTSSKNSTDDFLEVMYTYYGLRRPSSSGAASSYSRNYYPYTYPGFDPYDSYTWPEVYKLDGILCYYDPILDEYIDEEGNSWVYDP